MGQFLQINGDYNIKTSLGGKIVLDTGTVVGADSTSAYPGTVEVVGNLQVTGITTTISSVDLQIEDNILTLNRGEVGPYVSKDFAGLEVDRGDATGTPRAAFIYDDSNPSSTSWAVATRTPSSTTYNYSDSNIKIRKILTDSSYPDLILIGSGLGVISVGDRGAIPYEDLVVDDDTVPNKAYVDLSILNNPTFQIRAPEGEDTRVIIADTGVTPGNPGSISYQDTQTGWPTQGGRSAVTFIIDGQRVAHFYEDELILQDLTIEDNKIIAQAGIDIELETDLSGTGTVRTNRALRFNNVAATIASENDTTAIYSQARNTGGSGLFFVNASSTLGVERDELISKNRALVFSMLF